MSRLHLNECDECDGEPHSALEGLLAALAELHRTPPGQVRLVQVSCDASMSLGCDLPKLQRAFLLLQLLPAFVLGLPPLKGQGVQALLWAACDVTVAFSEAVFDLINLNGMERFLPMKQVPPFEGTLTATEAKELGLVSEIVEDEWQLWRSIEEICEKLSECAPTAVAQSKIFIHKVGSFPMNLRLHEDLAGHIARRMDDPEFEDSIRAVLDKAHVPIYRRPQNKIVPAHLLKVEEKRCQEWNEPEWLEDGTVLV
ncbi:unnamed protein product [Durusdinium trenchii]|uniref:Uncharacterized protein n=1 Tax=Durusdinium trenchii TaxID=1381693 RepID=A0ABP0IPY9_9DINO